MSGEACFSSPHSFLHKTNLLQLFQKISSEIIIYKFEPEFALDVTRDKPLLASRARPLK